VIDFDAKDTRSAPGALRHNPHIGSDVRAKVVKESGAKTD